ncbi:MAG: UV DNA damage repair endonuclease UvsE [Candidatus Lokiarchaeota archaeon]
MKVGYPCINYSLSCKNNKTFRLKNYSNQLLKDVVNNNLSCLANILKYNVKHNILFFRFTSDLIPFASHEIMDFDWKTYFREKFREIGSYVKNHNIRISMHPGQYIVLNSNNEDVFIRSLKEVEYHVDLLDLMDLDKSAKVQLHIGGVYGDKDSSIKRFIERYHNFDAKIKKRLVIENDDKSYNFNDCLKVYKALKIPIIFDVYHNIINPSGMPLSEIFKRVIKTWENKDGLPIIHYSSAHPQKGFPSHAEKIDIGDFKNFIESTRSFNFDVMLEIKDKEVSALKAIKLLKKDPRIIVK